MMNANFSSDTSMTSEGFSSTDSSFRFSASGAQHSDLLSLDYLSVNEMEEMQDREEAEQEMKLANSQKTLKTYFKVGVSRQRTEEDPQFTVSPPPSARSRTPPPPVAPVVAPIPSSPKPLSREQLLLLSKEELIELLARSQNISSQHIQTKKQASKLQKTATKKKEKDANTNNHNHNSSVAKKILNKSKTKEKKRSRKETEKKEEKKEEKMPIIISNIDKKELFSKALHTITSESCPELSSEYPNEERTTGEAEERELPVSESETFYSPILSRNAVPVPQHPSMARPSIDQHGLLMRTSSENLSYAMRLKQAVNNDSSLDENVSNIMHSPHRHRNVSASRENVENQPDSEKKRSSLNAKSASFHAKMSPIKHSLSGGSHTHINILNQLRNISISSRTNNENSHIIQQDDENDAEHIEDNHLTLSAPANTGKKRPRSFTENFPKMFPKINRFHSQKRKNSEEEQEKSSIKNTATRTAEDTVDDQSRYSSLVESDCEPNDLCAGPSSSSNSNTVALESSRFAEDETPLPLLGQPYTHVNRFLNIQQSDSIPSIPSNASLTTEKDSASSKSKLKQYQRGNNLSKSIESVSMHSMSQMEARDSIKSNSEESVALSSIPCTTTTTTTATATATATTSTVSATDKHHKEEEEEEENVQVVSDKPLLRSADNVSVVMATTDNDNVHERRGRAEKAINSEHTGSLSHHNNSNHDTSYNNKTSGSSSSIASSSTTSINHSHSNNHSSSNVHNSKSSPAIYNNKKDEDEESDETDDSYDDSKEDDEAQLLFDSITDRNINIDHLNVDAIADGKKRNNIINWLLHMVDPADTQDPLSKEQWQSIADSNQVVQNDPFVKREDSDCRYVDIRKLKKAPLIRVQSKIIESQAGLKIKEDLKAQDQRRYISVGSGKRLEEIQRKLKEKQAQPKKDN